MLTDWIVVRRLAAELDGLLRGARVRDAGLTAEGRLGIVLHGGAARGGLLSFDVFDDLAVRFEASGTVERTAGWQRAVSAPLVGMRVQRVRGRHGDRLIGIDFATRSAFGVQNDYRLAVELTPRFGNAVLLQGDTVVAAAKVFEGDGTRRRVMPGTAYEPPPLPQARGTPEALEAAAASSDAEAIASALRALHPLVPVLVARSLVTEALRVPWKHPHELVALLLQRADSIESALEGEPSGLGDVFVYRDAGRLVQAHVLPLEQFAGLPVEREPKLLPRYLEGVEHGSDERRSRAGSQTRTRIAERIARRLAALDRKRVALERERADSLDRDRWRVWGDVLYSHLGAVPPGATSFASPTDPGVVVPLDPELDAAANAAAMFKRYKKAGTKLSHVETQLADLTRAIAATSELAWEAQRVDAPALGEIAAELDRLEGRAKRTRAPQRALGPLEIPLSHDARLRVGRSPRGNADLTFRIAAPDDYWFHAKDIPGAHVVLSIDGAREPSAHELEDAASIAAYYSKARASPSVDVDYALRKFVRKQRDAGPGLVWYTNASTLRVAPRADVQPARSTNIASPNE